ncbi:winged helix-turn-helix domain-containing protein [Streptomyces sioyaensis]|uniref:BTAD domain-containing putative transcriptional regulator n=1 Tax=Streptomyces sioyaensis TaxID=67364 RepID=UPI001F2FC24E|nr:BTAD domain-containing putative transcriptional regulator [Streptomyces sioyaensis]MCF3171766.1 winged helix-turn-helix domain-containing protein [Streptomyces sioyaensis]
MNFRILGSLQAGVDGALMPLGGVIKRRLLAYLLLNANRVVATHKLLDVLWPDETPRTARKMVGNAVRGLRLDLAHGATDTRAAILTLAPGYQLRVDPDTVDLFRFRRHVERGRAEARAGDHAAAACTLRGALDLWGGVALADLADGDLNWPELDGLESERLGALEDYFEAGLAIGHHHEVLGELQRAVAEDPLRERLSGQLMVALYRCGRQTDALSVFWRIRTELVERFGLEPSRELRRLERSVLEHAPALEVPAASVAEYHKAPGRPTVPAPVAQQATRRPNAPDARDASSVSRVLSRVGREHRSDHGVVPDRVDDGERQGTGHRSAPRRTRVSVLLVGVRHDLSDDHDLYGAQQAMADIEAVLRQQSTQHGGTVGPVTAPVFSAVFGVDTPRRDDATRAVRTAVALRDRIEGGRLRTTPSFIGVHVAVVTGDACVSYLPAHSGVPTVTGDAVDRGFRLLAMAPRGQVRVCEVTRQATESHISYHLGPEPPDGWEALRIRTGAGHGLQDVRAPEPSGPPDGPGLPQLTARSL